MGDSILEREEITESTERVARGEHRTKQDSEQRTVWLTYRAIVWLHGAGVHLCVRYVYQGLRVRQTRRTSKRPCARNSASLLLASQGVHGARLGRRDRLASFSP